MNFRRYQEETTTTFKDHTPLDAHQARLLNWAVGLAGESGEVQELLKHHIFANEKLNKMDLAKELGDVLWYLSAIAETSGIKLDDIAALNLAKLQHRYYTGAYTDGEAQSRREREAKFTDTMLYRVLNARIMQTAAPMNVIFIGADGTGKTTLSKDVAKRMKFKYHKCNYLQENKPMVARHLLNSQIDVIYDRFYWPDDPLYCAVKKIEMPNEYWAQYSEVINLLQELNTLYIYVKCSKEELLLRSIQWKDDYVKQDELDAIVDYYSNWLNYIDKLHVSTCVIDTTGVKVGSADYESLVTGCCEAIKVNQKVYANILD